MIKISNLYFLGIILSYLIAIILTYYNYNNDCAISDIITKDNLKFKIFFIILLMSFFTLLYENESSDNKSFYIIITLLIGLICVNFTKGTKKLLSIHNLFSTIVFFTITIFMIYHLCMKYNNILCILFIFQIIITCMTFRIMYIKTRNWLE